MPLEPHRRWTLALALLRGHASVPANIKSQRKPSSIPLQATPPKPFSPSRRFLLSAPNSFSNDENSKRRNEWFAVINTCLSQSAARTTLFSGEKTPHGQKVAPAIVFRKPPDFALCTKVCVVLQVQRENVVEVKWNSSCASKCSW